MLDHVGIYVTDFGKAKRFYDLALAPLGIAQRLRKAFTSGSLTT